MRPESVGRTPPGSGRKVPPALSRFSLSTLAHFYRERYAVAISANLAYRGAVAIWIFVTLIQPLVFIVVWRTVAGSGETGGYTANQFVAYFLVMMLVDHLTFIWHMWEFEWRIRTGAFSPLLMRPIHPIHSDVCENLAYKTVGLVGVLPAAVVLGVAFDADLSGITVLTVLPFLIALVLAMVLRFVVEWCLALAAFWLTKVTAINSLFFGLTSFFGGVFAPLAVLPVWMQTVAVWTPFPWALAFPVEVALGRRTGADIWIGYAVQLGWIALALGGLALLWRRATKRYSAVGA
jgi:ABC-2 type transport system permease protein